MKSFHFQDFISDTNVNNMQFQRQAPDSSLSSYQLHEDKRLKTLTDFG